MTDTTKEMERSEEPRLNDARTESSCTSHDTTVPDDEDKNTKARAEVLSLNAKMMASIPNHSFLKFRLCAEPIDDLLLRRLPLQSPRTYIDQGDAGE